jgi:hypothetical protein
VLDGVATRMGLEPDANLQLNQATALTEYINDRLQKAWEYMDWPDWTTSELRQYRADWDSTATYAQGDEVYYPDSNAYYRSLQAANLNHLPTDPAWWVAASDLVPYIALEQSWEPTRINITWNVWSDDPKTIDRPRPVSWWLGPQGILINTMGTGLTKVYVEFGLVPPRFTTVEWDVARAYVPGDLSYYQGDCYEALSNSTGVPPTVGSDWRRQDFPAILARHVKLAATADALREDENANKATAWDLQADIELTDACDRAYGAMRAPHTYEVRGR